MTSIERPESKPLLFWLVSLCFFLSGMAGLVYQMVWMRYLSTVFGTSELAIVAVLVAYMGGLAAGAWVASKLLDRLRRPIIAYAILELAIAISAIAVPLLLRLASSLHANLLGGQAALPADGGIGEALAHLALGCFVLLVPTACMGATLPILAKGLVHRSSQIGGRIGWLYALNTFGAVAGTLVAAFLLIPSLGLWKASFFGVALNALVAGLGWTAAKRAGAPEIRGEPVPEDGAETAPTSLVVPPIAILVVMLVSGAISFAYEVLWARLLAHVLGGSLYSFATMLAAFLMGIALGGLLGARLAKDGRSSCHWLAGFEIATGVLTAIILAIVSGGGFGGGDGSIFGQAMLCAMVLTPATICLGATFPLAVRCLCSEPARAGAVAGRVYSWNTIGAIVGAVAAGLVIIPVIGYAATFKWAVVTNLLLAAIVLGAMRSAKKIGWVSAAVACLAGALLYHPEPPTGLMTRSPHERGEGHEGGLRLIHFATGRSATVAVLERNGSLVIRSNGLQEAEIFPPGAESISYTHIRWLPALPKVLNPGAESLLVVGFGGGTMLESVPSGFETVDVVEIEEEIIVANKLVADRRAIDPFSDQRLNIIINDARGALKLTDKRYDAIVSQPSHPWTAGASHLYTQEFLELSASHMNPGGVFVQWLGAQFVDEILLGSFCAAALEVFPHVQLYLVSDNFVIACSDGSLDERLWSGEGGLFPLSDYPKLSYIEDLLAVLQLDEAGVVELAKGRDPITDDRNLMATHHLPGNDLDGALDNPENLTSLIGPLHFLNRDPVDVRQQLVGAGVDLRYLTRLLKSSSPALDRKKFYSEVLTDGDRLIDVASSALSRQPDKAIKQIESAQRSGIAGDQALPLLAVAQFKHAAASWQSEKGTPMPSVFREFVSQNAGLASSFEKLSDAEKILLEARYLAAIGQIVRAGSMGVDFEKYNDHRSPWFEMAYELQLMALSDVKGKTEAQRAEDLATATGYIDQLLALPLERNLPLVQQRIALAQNANDREFLTSMAWIMARKLKQLPPGSSAGAAFSNLLGSLFSPYVQGSKISDRKMADLYIDLCDEIGKGAIALPIAPRG